MDDDRITRTEEALAPLWSLRPPMSREWYQLPEYAAFKAFCVTTFASADRGLGFSFGLTDALRAVGLPCLAGEGGAPTPAAAASDLVDAFGATSVRRRYLCPLNGADRLPRLRFGPAEVRRFRHDELLGACDWTRYRRSHPRQPIDPRLAEFHWLVVEERVPAPPTAGQRAMPQLYEDWSRDLGAVEPHAGGHPGPVHDALFGLLLAPWEEWVSDPFDWRPFSIPWVHVVSDDPFAPRRLIPDADTLSWHDVTYTGHGGEPIEAVRPVETDLNEAAEAHLCGLDEAWWARVEAARGTSLLETPVEHFLVRAAMSDGIDQIMAHMTAIEAAIGLESDFSNRGRAKADQMPATRRMAKRVGGLLGDAQAEANYRSLFDLRSGFVHGRRIEGAIPSRERTLARSLARRVAAALVDAAAGPAGSAVRADWLNAMA